MAKKKIINVPSKQIEDHETKKISDPRFASKI